LADCKLSFHNVIINSYLFNDFESYFINYFLGGLMEKKSIVFTVIVLVLFAVIAFLGYSLYESIQVVQVQSAAFTCSTELIQQGISFRAALTEAVAKKTVKNFSFSQKDFIADYGCMSSELKASFRLEQDARVCSARCDRYLEKCFELTLVNPNVPGGFSVTCVDLPEHTVFLSNEANLCNNSTLLSQGFKVLEMGATIPIGSYAFEDVSSTSDTYPMVCVWYKAN
jgi:hypothetical protein